MEAERGIRLSVRIGIDSGEVVAGDPAEGQTLVTGDAVNTASRLEGAAGPSEILIGAATHHLVRDAVEVEEIPPLQLKGKSHPVVAYRLRSVTAGAAARARRLDAPLIGRDRELARLRQAYEQAVVDRAPQLFTVLGSAGVGKSRLVAEFLESIEQHAVVLKGRCLPYGEGITYWPVGEIVRAAAAITEHDSSEEATRKISELGSRLRDPTLVATRVASAIGLVREAASQEDVFQAIRHLFESIAASRPTAILFEDVHWGESTFLDLIEYICDSVSRTCPCCWCAARAPNSSTIGPRGAAAS